MNRKARICFDWCSSATVLVALGLLAACGANTESGAEQGADTALSDAVDIASFESDGAPSEDSAPAEADTTPEPGDGGGDDISETAPLDTAPDADGVVDVGDDESAADTDGVDADAVEADTTSGSCGEAPPTGCYADDSCGDGQQCSIVDGAGCLPSRCDCDTTTGTWACTRDCALGICIDKPVECEGPNPAGCVGTGCEPGEVCAIFPAGPCVPSSCSCDIETGIWFCTEDCGGGVCVPEGATPCATDADCTPGAQWCEENACVECDNSAFLCRIACEPGTGLVTRNECHPCVCEADNACLSDSDCGSTERCAPGPDCLGWCPEGDPSCCYGNTCVERAE